MKQGFPFYASHATVSITVGATTGNVDLGLDAGYTDQVEIFNATTETIFIKAGDSSVTAALASGRPIPSGAVICTSLPPFATKPYIAAIGTGATGKIYFTPGRGW